jgi:hypothetical protein
MTTLFYMTSLNCLDKTGNALNVSHSGPKPQLAASARILAQITDLGNG